jgi:hypothetical protein
MFDRGILEPWKWKLVPTNISIHWIRYIKHSADNQGDFLPAVSLGVGRTAKQISAGTYHACAILDDDSAKCWGYNNVGQLGAVWALPRVNHVILYIYIYIYNINNARKVASPKHCDFPDFSFVWNERQRISWEYIANQFPTEQKRNVQHITDVM